MALADPALASLRTLANQQVELTFDVKPDGLDLWAFSEVGKDNLLLPGESRLFSLLPADGVELSAKSGWSSVVATFGAQTGTFTFTREGPDPVQVELDVQLLENQAHFTMSRLVCPSCDLSKIQFPRVKARLVPGGTVHVPQLGGDLYDMFRPDEHRVFVIDYPGSWGSYQMMGAVSSHEGLYLAHHDPFGLKKAIVLDKLPGERGFEVKTYWRGLKDGRPSGPFVLAAQPGDWYDHAEIYRRWTNGNEPIWHKSSRNRTNRIHDVDYWVVSGCDPAQCLRQLKDVRGKVSGKIGFHWYNWHQIPFDTKYPNFFPAKVGFEQVVRELQLLDIVVMPYISGQLWDNQVEAEYPEAFANSVCRADGSPAIFQINNLPFSSGCPATQWWRDVVTGLVRRLVNEVHVDAVYLDSVAAGYGACHSTAHDHLPGWGPDFLTNGYYRILASMRAEFGDALILATEGNAEPYVNQFDGFLSWNFMHAAQRPIFASIFGPATQLFGRFHDNREPSGGLKALRMKAGQALAFGEAIGWYYPYAMGDAEYETIERFARFRRTNIRYFLGDMRRQPAVTSPVGQVTANWWTMYQRNDVTLKAIQTGAFAADGRTMAVFVNVGEGSESFTYTVEGKKGRVQGAMTLGAGQVHAVFFD